ncbi:MAG: glutamate 5-kinase [Clostridia bacterium]|nr:glutamate 5-kinase [Clostridia bacterium]
MRTKIIKNTKRLVVKLGTSSISQSTGKPDLRKMEEITEDIISVMDSGVEVVLVSSGAVGTGVSRLGFSQRPNTIPEKQAAAAVGQGILIQNYEKLFEKHGKVIAQILLTREDIADRNRYLNARNTLTTLLDYGVIPIVNENDTVAIEEIQFGDNDRLSALVSCLIDADLLIILSDIDGVYTCDPRTNPQARLIPLIEDIDSGIECTASGRGSKFGTGGMVTKIQAAKIATHSGIPMIVANSSRNNIIHGIISGGDNTGTLFLPNQRLHSKKRWIGFGSYANGKIHVDSGAEKAMVQSGKSLLPSGIIKTGGSFVVGNVISVVGCGGGEIARGIVNYSAEEVELIKGRHTDEIEEILGFRTCPEVIHRDNLTITI